MFGERKKKEKNKKQPMIYAASEWQSVTSVMCIAQVKEAHLLVQEILRTAQFWNRDEKYYFFTPQMVTLNVMSCTALLVQ